MGMMMVSSIVNDECGMIMTRVFAGVSNGLILLLFSCGIRSFQDKNQEEGIDWPRVSNGSQQYNEGGKNLQGVEKCEV